MLVLPFRDTGCMQTSETLWKRGGALAKHGTVGRQVKILKILRGNGALQAFKCSDNFYSNFNLLDLMVSSNDKFLLFNKLFLALRLNIK